jgi:acetyl-CoA C-acetyltransferase
LKARGHPVGASGLAQVVEAVKTLRGQIPAKRQFKRGLTQSTGGLGTNNFVTILERADAIRVKNPGSPFSALPVATALKKVTPLSPTSNEGEIETFTILYTTPDGFLAPLALALIRDKYGHLVMAQGEDNGQLKIGREVYLKRIDDYYLFTVKSQFRKMQESLKRFLWRGAATLFKVENAVDKKL